MAGYPSGTLVGLVALPLKSQQKRCAVFIASIIQLWLTFHFLLWTLKMEIRTAQMMLGGQ